MHRANEAVTIDADVSRRQRPWSVTVATLCVALSYMTGLISWIFTGHWRELIVPFVYAAVCALVFFYVRALYRGSRWARWLTVIVAGFGVVGLPPVFASFTADIGQILFLTQTLLHIIAAVLLLLPASGRWFSPK